MSIFDIFKRSSSPQNLGALLDTRPPEKIALDYHISEIVASAAPVVWKEEEPGNIRAFPVQNQNQKSDCVAESRRKLRRIIWKVNRNLDLDFSAVAFYRKRSNFPAEGMGSMDAIDLDRKTGMTLDALVPSDAITTEAKANALEVADFNKDIAKCFLISNEVTYTPGNDFETIAGTIQKTRKGVMVWFFFTQDEWAREFVTVRQADLVSRFDSRCYRHSVVAVEPAIFKGVKGFWVEDSAHFGGLARRFVTEDFFRKRNFWASYPINFTFDVQNPNDPVKPKYQHPDVKSLQDCLKWEGLFPLNVDSTGVFGNITTKGVKDFQTKYGLEPVGTVGPLTRAKLESLYP